jgi:hypothetical protein
LTSDVDVWIVQLGRSQSSFGLQKPLGQEAMGALEDSKEWPRGEHRVAQQACPSNFGKELRLADDPTGTLSGFQKPISQLLRSV